MALNLPGPTTAVSSITDTTVVINFTNLPAGTTAHWLAWGRPGQAITLSGPANASNNVTITAPDSQFVVAMGFSYDGATIYGPGPIIAFTAPHNVFPSFVSNNAAIQGILNQLSSKLSIQEYQTYSDVLDARMSDAESDQRNLAVQINRLFAALSAALRKFQNP